MISEHSTDHIGLQTAAHIHVPSVTLVDFHLASVMRAVRWGAD